MLIGYGRLSKGFLNTPDDDLMTVILKQSLQTRPAVLSAPRPDGGGAKPAPNRKGRQPSSNSENGALTKPLALYPVG